MKPVRHSMHRTPNLTQQACCDGKLQYSKRQGLSLSTIARILVMFLRRFNVKYASWGDIFADQTSR